jgi:hypothetical protein
MFILLVLEVLVLSVFMLLGLGLTGRFGLFSLFFFLVVGVCMGGYRVSLLVRVSRCFGRDFWFFSFLF